MTQPTATTIDEVLEKLDRIIAECRERGNSGGYFAALYRRVTAEVGVRIVRGDFDDGPRMERFDVIFANRYLVAWSDHGAGRPTAAAWRLAFAEHHAFWPVVLQHLLLGMNAHINFDLGLSAAAVAPGRSIHDLKPDFDRINLVLADQVDDVQECLAGVWPPLRWIDGVGGSWDEAVINFSLRRARDCAWSLATTLAGESANDARQARERAADDIATAVGRRVRFPGLRLALLLKFVRLRERGSFSDKLALIASGAGSVAPGPPGI